MIINKCDICGMTEGLRYLDDDGNKRVVTFAMRPIVIRKRNYRGEDYTVYVNVVVEKDSDHRKLQDALAKMQSGGGIDVMETILAQMTGIPRKPVVQLDNPYPSICDSCRNKILLSCRAADGAEVG